MDPYSGFYKYPGITPYRMLPPNVCDPCLQKKFENSSKSQTELSGLPEARRQTCESAIQAAQCATELGND